MLEFDKMQTATLHDLDSLALKAARYPYVAVARLGMMRASLRVSYALGAELLRMCSLVYFLVQLQVERAMCIMPELCES